MAELVDARDLKSLGVYPCTSSILVPGTNNRRGLKLFIVSSLFFILEFSARIVQVFQTTGIISRVGYIESGSYHPDMITV